MPNRKIQRPTMDDVAADAGVSQMTVSRVMRAKGYVSKDVREKVNASARRLGYVQNQLARGLRAEQSPLVAVVVPTLRNRVFTEVLSGLTDALTPNGFRPVFGVTEYDPAQEAELVRDLLSWRPAGILLSGLEHQDETRAALAATNVRVVEIMDIDGPPVSVAVGMSQRAAGAEMAVHMLQKGYRKFAYIGSQDRNDLRAAKRLEGFRDTILSAGARMISQTIGAQPSSMLEGRRMTCDVMARSERPDAIYFSNDDLAAGGIMHCLAQGISVPDTVALAGFNGLAFLEALPIRLTTIETPRYEIGLRAGAFLAGEIAVSGPTHVDMGFTLLPGETT